MKTKEEEIKEFLDEFIPRYAETFKLLAEWDKENGENNILKKE